MWAQGREKRAALSLFSSELMGSKGQKNDFGWKN